MSNENTAQFYDLFTTHEYIQDKQVKTSWIRIGSAFPNRDGSYNLRLRALPLTDVKTGTANIHMRLHEDKPTGENSVEGATTSTYLPIDPVSGAPIEDL